MVYGTQITIVTGAYKLTYNWGASHCINKGFFFRFSSLGIHHIEVNGGIIFQHA